MFYEKYLQNKLTTKEQNCLENVKKARADWDKNGLVSDEVFRTAYQDAQYLNKIFFLKTLQMVYGEPVLKSDLKLVSGDGTKIILIPFKNDSIVYSEKFLKLAKKKFVFYCCQQLPGWAAHLQGYYPHLDFDWSIPPIFNNQHLDYMRSRSMAVVRHWNWTTNTLPFSGSLPGYLGLKFDNSAENIDILKISIKRILAYCLASKFFIFK